MSKRCRKSAIELSSQRSNPQCSNSCSMEASRSTTFATLSLAPSTWFKPIQALASHLLGCKRCLRGSNLLSWRLWSHGNFQNWPGSQSICSGLQCNAQRIRLGSACAGQISAPHHDPNNTHVDVLCNQLGSAAAGLAVMATALVVMAVLVDASWMD